ncbi:MAG: ABC transporter permease [Acidobacteriota bacterium]|nr:ABC transporter permease [Acidobacteriota bacterium]
MLFRDFRNFCRNLLYKQRVAQDLDQELHSYLELVAEEKVRSGMGRDEALQEARREIGGVEQLKESVRDVKIGTSMDNLLQDLRYGLRVLRRSPGFAATSILTLALGIGTTTAIFSVVDAVVFKPLPFPTADRLVRIKSVIAASGLGSIASYPDFIDWRTRNHVFNGMAVFRTDGFTLIGPGEPLHLQGAVVSAQLFSLLHVTPSLGRRFLPQEDNPAATSGTDPVILSYSLWQREFSSDTAALGRTVRLGDRPFTVVGVMPQGFQFPIQAEPVELWTTIAIDARGGANAMTAQRGAHYLDVVGLLKPGIKLQQAQAEMAAIASTLNKQHPENKPRSVRIVPEIQSLVGPIRTPLLVLLGAVSCVLLIVCVNIANLLLARATGRKKEMAVRGALGASRRRATRQLLTESLALSLLGGGLGLVLALSSLRLLVQVVPAGIPRLNAVGLDVRLLSFAFLISLLAGIFFGIAPALEVSKISLTESLNESGRGSCSEGKGHSRIRSALVVSEIALAAVLLLGASLFIQSFVHLMRVDPGFDPHHVLTFQLDAPAGKPGLTEPAFFRDVVERVNTIPGVTSASVSASLPLMGDTMGSNIEIEGQPTPMGSRPSADFNVVEPRYFRTMGIVLIQGRDFTEHDDSKSTPVVIVNRTLVRRFFANQDPIGKHVRPGIGNGYGPGEPPMREIVGVIGDAKQSGLNAEAAPEVYAPLAQSPFGTMFVVIRSANDPRSIVGAARTQIVSLDKNEPIYHVLTLDQYRDHSVVLPRLLTTLLSIFAGLALLLACVGIYGVISYIVTQRTHEIGIRMALGSQKSDVLRMIVGEGLRPALAGVTIGIVVAIKLTRLLSSLLYGVKPNDPFTFAAVALILMAVALLACYIPARRAANVDPMLSLRYE